MYCQTCGDDMMGGCGCDHWDFATPISSIRIRASGETTDPWLAREFSRYVAEVEFGGKVVELSLSFLDNREEEQFDAPRPTGRFLKNLNRQKWEVVEETDDETVFEIPNPFYTAKLVRVPKKNCFMLIADAVDLDSSEGYNGCGPGGRAFLVFSTEEGESLLADYHDHFTRSSSGWSSDPYNIRGLEDGEHPCDWWYIDRDVREDDSRVKRVPSADRADAR